MSYKAFGIDVSQHKGKINWEKVKPNIDFAILRCGFGDNVTKQDDTRFIYNADECTRLEIPFGVYLCSYADSIEHAQSEAYHVLRMIKGYKLSYPVWYDLETPPTEKCSPEFIQRMVKTFCDILEENGYYVGVYAGLRWWQNYLNGEFYDRYARWVAQYNSAITECSYKKPKAIWQYSSSGHVDGISILQKVDFNYCYIDYPSIIKSAGLNGWKLKNTYSYDNTVEALINDGIIDITDMQNWEKMLDGREKLNADLVRTLFNRYHAALKRK